MDKPEVRNTPNKYQIGKLLAMMVYMDSGFKIFTFTHDRMAFKINRCQEVADIHEWNINGKPLWSRKTLKKKPP